VTRNNCTITVALLECKALVRNFDADGSLDLQGCHQKKNTKTGQTGDLRMRSQRSQYGRLAASL
jgi:hypothetical protein